MSEFYDLDLVPLCRVTFDFKAQCYFWCMQDHANIGPAITANRHLRVICEACQ